MEDKEREVCLLVEKEQGPPGLRVPRRESVLNPAMTKGQFAISTAISRSRERVPPRSPMPPGQESGRSETLDSQEKKNWNSLSMACFPQSPMKLDSGQFKKTVEGKRGSQNLGQVRV